MKVAKKPSDEELRIATLNSYEILDTIAEREIDDLVQLAADICQAPIALVSLVDKERQWFKSRVGLDATETPRDVAFCSHAILKNEIFVVEDSRKDERFATNPLVCSEPNVVFYAGVPLKVREGHNLGTLCVIDHVPRQLSRSQLTSLKRLANLVVDQIHRRKITRIQERQENDLHDFSKMLSRVHRLNLTSYDNKEEMFQDYLRTASELFGLPLGIVSEVKGDEYKVLAAVSPGDSLQPGTKFELKDTYCEMVFKDQKTVSFANAGLEDRVKDHPCYIAMKLESYISTPLFLREKLVGTLNFSSPDIRNHHFSQYEIHLIELLAKAIARRMEIFLQSEEIHQQSLQVSQLQRQISIERLAGGVAHEINNPLAILAGYAEQLPVLLKQENINSPKITHVSEKIEHSVQRVAKIVRALLVFSKDESNQVRELARVEYLFDQAIDLLGERIHDAGIRVKMNVPEGLQIECNRMEMVEAIYALLLNSFHALKNVESPQIDLRGELKDDQVYLTVGDNGEGVPQSLEGVLFEPFSSNKEVGQGQGLGLSIAKGLVEANCGGIELLSPKQPTQFVIKVKAS